MNPNDSVHERLAADGAGTGDVTGALTIPRIEPPIASRPFHPEVTSGGVSSWLHALRRRWMLGLFLGLVGGGAGAVIGWYTWTPVYSPVATLRIASQQPVLMYVTKDASEQSPFDIYKKTQQQLIRDPFVLNAALRNPAVVKLPIITQQLDAVDWLQKEIVVSFPGDAEILDISMRGEDPEAATAIVNAVCDAYVDGVVRAEHSGRMERLDRLEKINSDAEEKVRQKRSELKNLTESLGTGDSHAATQKQQIALESYAALRKEQLSVQLQLMRAEAKLAVQQAKFDGLDAQPLPPDLVEAGIQAQSEYAASSQALDKLREEFRSAESLLADGQQRSLDRKRKEITSAEQQLGQVRTRLKPMVESQLRQSLQLQTKTDLAAAEADVQTLHAEDERLGKEVDKLGGEANQIGKSSVDLEMLRAELDGQQTIQKQLATEVENMKIEMASAARVELLSRAEVPRAVDNKARARQTETFGALGFFLPLVWICWNDLRRKPVNTPLDVSSSLGLPIIGTMPLVPLRAHRRLALSSQPSIWSRVLKESIDSIRETLLTGAQAQKLKVVVITSASEGEGKTTIATQLAKSIASAGHRTLLMDCDLRRPATQLAFPSTSGSGLLDVMDETTALNEVIYPTRDSHLYHLPVGALRASSTDTIGGRRSQLASIFLQLRDQFDFVVVDSGPILPVVDTLVIGQFADAAVLSIMRDVSRSYEVIEACSRLARVGIKVLGAIVTSKSNIYGSNYRYDYTLSGSA